MVGDITAVPLIHTERPRFPEEFDDLSLAHSCLHLIDLAQAELLFCRGFDGTLCRRRRAMGKPGVARGIELTRAFRERRALSFYTSPFLANPVNTTDLNQVLTMGAEMLPPTLILPREGGGDGEGVSSPARREELFLLTQTLSPDGARMNKGFLPKGCEGLRESFPGKGERAREGK